MGGTNHTREVLGSKAKVTRKDVRKVQKMQQER
jgi:hypothetical protein